MSNEACLYVRERERLTSFFVIPFLLFQIIKTENNNKKPRCLKAGGKEQLHGLTALSLETMSF